MKRQHIVYLIIGLSVLLTISCKENEMSIYSDAPGLYFARDYNQSDSIKHTFFIYKDDVKEDTVWVRVNTMGFPADTDRPFALLQTNAGKSDAAIPGVHFVSFGDPEIKKYFVIPAHQVEQRIPIVFLRDKSLATEEYRIELTIDENEYFRPGIDKMRNFMVSTTDEAVKPQNWNRWQYTFGPTWGSVKMKFIIQVTGLTDFDTIPDDYSYQMWLSGTVQQALLDYNNEHPDAPLCEADGTLVTFDF